MTAIVVSASTSPSTDGPATIPATISITTEGRRTRGKSPSTKGAAKAIATTTSRPPKDGTGHGPCRRRIVTAPAASL